MFWPNILLLSTIIFWLALCILLTVKPRKSNMSVSRHSAANRNTYIFFTPAQIAMSVVSLLFVVKWLIPEYELGWFFTSAYLTTTVLQLSAALIPDKVEGFKSRVHLEIANAMAVGMCVSVFALCLSRQITGFPKFFLWVTFIYMVSAILLIVSKKGRPERLKYYLYIQVVYFVLLQVSILFVAFLR